MRFRGGGVGHMYMRQVEPWLEATGWGATWPSLHDREPDASQEEPMHVGDGAGPSAPMASHQCGGGNDNSGDEDSGEDTGPGELDDNDGEDLEQPEEEDDYDSEEDVNPSGDKDKPTRFGDGEHGGRGDETDEEEEESHHL